MPWYPCCGPAAPECNWCTADADTITVTPQGFGDGSCGCSAMNDVSYVLSRSGLNACNWNRVDSLLCGGVLTNVSFNAWAMPGIYGEAGWKVLIAIGTSSWSFYWKSGALAAFDCTASRSCVLETADDGAGICGGTPSCIVN